MLEGEPFYKSCEQLAERKRCGYLDGARAVESVDCALLEAGMKGHNALFRESYGRGLCAYEITAKIARESEFIIADYAHVLNPFTLKAFAKKIGHPIKDSILIWDEAHNIMNIASSYLSTSISTQAVGRASKELASIGSSIDLGYLDYFMQSLSESKLKTSSIAEAFFGRSDIPKILSGGADTDAICDQLDSAGMEYVNASKAKRSSLMHISRFIRSLSSRDEASTMIVSRYGKGIRLSVACLYPAEAIMAMKEAYANVFMSGTLLPLGMHKELLSLPGRSRDELPVSVPEGEPAVPDRPRRVHRVRAQEPRSSTSSSRRGSAA